MYLKASFWVNKMKRVISIFDALKVATGVGCRAMESAQRSFQNVLPMCYPLSKNPRKLFTYKGIPQLFVTPKVRLSNQFKQELRQLYHLREIIPIDRFAVNSHERQLQQG